MDDIWELCEACECGNLENVKNLINVIDKETLRNGKNMFPAVRIAIGNKRLDVLKCLEAKYKLTHEEIRAHDNFMFGLACNTGYTELVMWMIDTYNFTKQDAIEGYTLRCSQQSCLYGGDANLYVMLSNRYFTIEDINAHEQFMEEYCPVAYNNYQEKIIRWMYEKFMKEYCPVVYNNYQEKMIRWRIINRDK